MLLIVSAIPFAMSSRLGPARVRHADRQAGRQDAGTGEEQESEHVILIQGEQILSPVIII